jgi:putative oxidoreductase
MSTSSNSILPLVARILLATTFIVPGLLKIPGYSMTVAYASMKGLPLASVSIVCAIVLEVLGGVALLIGFQTRIAAWVLFVYLIPTTLIFHNFWAIKVMEQQQDNMVHFLKNLAIMGGLLLLAAYGPGAYSLDERKAAA